MNEFFFEKSIFGKVDSFQKELNQLKVLISQEIKRKAAALEIKVPLDLENRMSTDVNNCQKRHFFCEICNKKFDDGRKLGGHISRAHPGQTNKNKVAKQDRLKKKNKATDIINEKDMEDEYSGEDENEDCLNQLNGRGTEVNQTRARRNLRLNRKRQVGDHEGGSRNSKQSSKSNRSRKVKKQKRRHGAEVKQEIHSIYDEDAQ